jgi:hypothetical protein
MFVKKILPLSVVVLISAVILGCAPTMVGTDMGVYHVGKLYSVSDKDIDTVYAATLQAMEKLQLEVIDKAKDVFAAKVIAKTADGKVVVVLIKPLAENKTEYSIRVGTFGSEERSRKIFMEIKNILAEK